MKKICVCQFDKFVLQHLIRPYQNMIGLGDEVVKRNPFIYEELYDKLNEGSEWSNLVLSRASRIGFKFSEYIPSGWRRGIVDLIEDFKNINN